MNRFLSLWDASKQNTPKTVNDMEMAVVVPTLNEAGNVDALLDGILAADPRLHVIIVDDGSADGTLEIVNGKVSETNRVHLIARGRKLGYASAVQDGMRLALAGGARLICQMDADFSHDPQALPALLAKSEECDLVIGSRYVRGGGTRRWPLHRQLLSRGANAGARALLRLPNHDCTGGFRCWRADILQRSGALDVDVQGYAFLFITLDLCRQAGARIGETPIIFTERQCGQSKMNRRIIFEAARLLLGLWWQRLRPQPTAPLPASVAPSLTLLSTIEQPQAGRRAA